MQRVIIIPFLVACGSMTEDEFLLSYSQEKCAYTYSCVSEDDQNTLDEIYGSQEQCSEDMKADLVSSVEANNLLFQSSQAKECLAHLETLECNTEPSDDDPCNLVWTIEE